MSETLEDMGSFSRIKENKIFTSPNTGVEVHNDLLSVEESLIRWFEEKSFDRIIIKPNWVASDPLTRTEVDLFASTVKVCVDQCKSVIIADCPIDLTNFNQVKSYYESHIPKKNVIIKNLWKDNSKVIDLGNTSFFMPLLREGIKEFMMGSQRATPQKYHFEDTNKYGVSETIYESEGIIHLPRLKTHRLAGMTGCAKSYIGTVVKKYWLPHFTMHYDQPPLSSAVQRRLTISKVKMKFHLPTGLIPSFLRKKILRVLRAQTDINAYLLGGAWEGNDTIWRTIFDLVTIFIDIPQFYILDGRIAGQGEGPMKPIPLVLNKLWTGKNPLAIDSSASLELEKVNAKMPKGWTSPYIHNNIRMFQAYENKNIEHMKFENINQALTSEE
ncbi:MAG: DUF362 domain-containing protein [Candidatus Hodarchaeales archaeon]|jgi:uncharacterized protein (DUF362 family)